MYTEYNQTDNESRTYNAWKSLKQRCDNPKSPAWDHYGGKGVIYDPRWKDYWVFLEDMGEAPAKHSIGRIMDQGHYCQENCEWQTDKQQGAHKRYNNFFKKYYKETR